MVNAPGHLPAGQGMQGGNTNNGMASGPGGGVGGGVGAGGGPHRRGGGRQHYNPHHQSQYGQQQMYPQPYSPHMSQPPFNPYAHYGGAYYPGQHQPGGAGMGAPAYMPSHMTYANHMAYAPGPNGYHSRPPPPPPMPQQYMGMPPQQQHYSRQAQHSPIVPSPYQPPTQQGPPPVHVAPRHQPNPHAEAFGPSLKSPGSYMTHVPAPYDSLQPVMPLASEPQEFIPLPPVEQIAPAAAPPAPVQAQAIQEKTPTPPPAATPVVEQTASEDGETPSIEVRPEMVPTSSFTRPSLPWLSVPDEPFPKSTPKLRRRRRMLEAGDDSVELPQIQQNTLEAEHEAPLEEETKTATASVSTPTPKGSPTPKPSSPEPAQDLASDGTTSTAPTTPSSAQLPLVSSASTSGPSTAVKSAAPRAAVPALPVVPALPKATVKSNKPASLATEPSNKADAKANVPPEASAVAAAPSTEATANDSEAKEAGTQQPVPAPAPAPVKQKPTSWAALLQARNTAVSSPQGAAQADSNGTAAGGADASPNGPSNFARPTKSSLGEALQAYRVGKPEKISFLEPRGLINNGNMCYMNSVLQVLLFCIPFYDFLDQVGDKAAFSFKGDTPLIHAMINFQKEFNVIDSASSAEALRKRLKPEQLERYGEQFIPKFVYDAIRKLKRFDTMQRGHQQDAEEFLGFLLAGLDEECAQAMQAIPQSGTSTANPTSSVSTPAPSVSAKATGESGDDWLEVGPRQRAAITRSSGLSTATPINKIFGGSYRSEFKVPGQKPSITMQPYQALPLDIGAPDIHNVVDAMKHITRTETLHGDFGPNGKATKTVFVEALPNVLILHLKRFHFDANKDGTVKIWKQIGYPLELDVPLECLSRQTRNQITAEGSGAPRYRLVSAVYHHGNEASGGHYTVDVRRQDGQEWIRIDDTIIRRVRSEDVAEAGAEEKAVKIATSDSRRDASTGPVANRFGVMNDEDTGDDDGWNKVSPTNGNKKYSSVANGTSTPPPVAKTAKHLRGNLSDNKVAYLLFYERI